VVGSGAFGLRDDLFGSATPPPRAPATGFVAVAQAPKAKPTVLRSQPWWQQVATARGSGDGQRELELDRSAIQWRVRWNCRAGAIAITGGGQSLARASCPRSGSALSTDAAVRSLSVRASGSWTLKVDQQIDLPLERPPLATMTSGRRVASGRLYGIDQKATGTATFYRLPSGRLALRLASFYVTPNVDLELRLSARKAPKTTREYRSADSALVAPLPITAGSLNFMVPLGVTLAGFRSLVVWCPPAKSAYGAVTLAAPK